MSMGVDVHILIRHDFYELEDYDKSIAFVKRTIDRFKKIMSINGDYEHFELYGRYDDEIKFSDISFRIPLNGVWLYLRKGYWNIWTGRHACQVTNKFNGRLHISDLAYDTAQALGAAEAWYCDEFFAEDCDFKTFDELKEIAEIKYGIIEYPYRELMKYKDNQFPDYSPFYHDSFEQRDE